MKLPDYGTRRLDSTHVRILTLDVGVAYHALDKPYVRRSLQGFSTMPA